MHPEALPSSRSLERIVADHSTLFLALLSIMVINSIFIVAILHSGYDLCLILLYLSFVLFYSVLYFRSWLKKRGAGAGLIRRHQRRALRRGLGYAAIALGASTLSLLSYGFAPAGMPATNLRVGVGLGLAVIAAYFIYRLIVLHLEYLDDDEVSPV